MNTPTKKTMKYHYVKSHNFFEAPLHGVFSGYNEDGHLVICPFTERMAIPQEHEVMHLEDGKTSHKTSGKDGNVRTVHGALHLNVEELRELVNTLQETLERFEKKNGL